MVTNGVSRRSFLLAGGSVALLAACTPTSTPTVAPTTAAPTATQAPLPTVRELIGRATFVVAHRGSGDNWPEHTLTAYRNALAAGADAVEISVCATSDGVLICHHDTSASRVLGVDALVSELSWPQVQALQVDARAWLGPETPLEPVARLDEVLATLGDDVLAFVEDKQGTNTGALLDLLDAQSRATERFVWKQWAGAGQITAAKERGYAAWGYFDEGQIDRVDEFATTFDVLGIPVSSSDDVVRRVVGAGCPVMAWEVHFHEDVARLTALGVSGLMCANVEYLHRGAPATEDAFASGRRAAGDLPDGFDRFGWAAQPQLVPERAALRIQRAGATSYLMGSLADPTRSVQQLQLTVTWPDAVPSTGRAGCAFALTTDAPGAVGQPETASGYQLTLDQAGAVELRARDVGATDAQVLGLAQIATPAVDVPQMLTVTVDGELITVMADGGAQPVLRVADARWRGSWVRLVKDYESSEAVEFSAVRVSVA